MIERELMIKAENGEKSSMLELGKYYYEQKYFGFAFYWINKSAKAGEVEAMYLLGSFYRKGVGVKINLSKAYKWYVKAAKLNNVKAIVSLVGDYFEGVYKTSCKNALGLCKQAATSDRKLGEYYLGLCYYKGAGVKRNIELARYHFTMSAINGFEFAKAQLSDKLFNIVV